MDERSFESTKDNSKESEIRNCRCPLCGQVIIAKNQEECIEHMSNCDAFSKVHPGSNQPTNFDYFNNKKKTNAEEPSTLNTEIHDAIPTEANDAEGGVNIEDMSVRQLKDFIKASGLKLDGCIEKCDLIERAKQAQM